MTEKLIIFGTADYAQIVYTFLNSASDFEIVAFTTHGELRDRDELFGLPVVDLETISESYPADQHKMYVAVAQSKLNKVRAKVYQEVKDLGYELISYVHPGVQIWPNVSIGDNCFIFDGCTINPFSTIGNDVIIWSGTVIGHHTTVGDHGFLAGHAVVSGHVNIGPYTYVGVNATIRDYINVAEDCMIGANSLIMRSTKPRQVFVADRTRASKQDTYQFMGIEPD
jgi:sugar O-acyltransferase (sialic acid O-acetyltransferase NeuD family)